MKKLLLALVLVSVGGVMADVLPRGSYQGSCRDCTFENNILTCQCNKGNCTHFLMNCSSLDEYERGECECDRKTILHVTRNNYDDIYNQGGYLYLK